MATPDATKRQQSAKSSGSKKTDTSKKTVKKSEEKKMSSKGGKMKENASQGPVEAALVGKAVEALLQHHQKQVDTSDKTSLLGSDTIVQVQFGLEVAPVKSQPKPIRIMIPHPFHKVVVEEDHDDEDGDGNKHSKNPTSSAKSPKPSSSTSTDWLDEAELCLIVKDESKAWVEETIAHFPDHLGCIKKVVGLQTLRTDYHLFRQRRALLHQFDLFLADDRILPMLTKALGKTFLHVKKQPIPIALTRKEALPFAIQRALSATFMILSEGTCVTVKAGTTAMPPAVLVENILAVTDGAVDKIPRKWANIRSIGIKTPSSACLPVYNKTPQELMAIAEMAGLDPVWKDEPPAEEKQEKKATGGGRVGRKWKVPEKSPLLRALRKQKKREEDQQAAGGKKGDAKRPAESDEKAVHSKTSTLDPMDQTGDKESAEAAKDMSTSEKPSKKAKKTKENNSEPADAEPASSSMSKPSGKQENESKDLNVANKKRKQPSSSSIVAQADTQKKAKPENPQEASIKKNVKNQTRQETESGNTGKKSKKEEKGTKSPNKTPSKKTDAMTAASSGSKASEQADQPDNETATKNNQGKLNAKVDGSLTVSQVKKSTSKSTDLKPKPTSEELPTSKSADFIVSKKFTGSKPGYVFRKGPNGVGYYVDVQPVVDKMALDAIYRVGPKKGERRNHSKPPGKQRGRRPLKIYH